MFSFLQQFTKRRADDAVDEEYTESSESPAFVPPAPLVKAPPTDEELAQLQRDADEAAARLAEKRTEEELVAEATMLEERRLAEERLAERHEKSRRIAEERLAEEQRREEEHRAAEAREREKLDRERLLEEARVAEENRIADEARAEVEARVAEEARIVAEERARVEAEERARIAAEEARIAAEEARIAAEEEARSAAEEARRAAEEERAALEASLVDVAEEPHAYLNGHSNVLAAPEAVETRVRIHRVTWPATLLHHDQTVDYGEAARRKLIATIVELDDEKLASVLHDALYEERADGLRPEALAALRHAYHGEALRETYERFARIGSEREREIARAALHDLDADGTVV